MTGEDRTGEDGIGWFNKKKTHKERVATSRAFDNVERWGEQTPVELSLAIVEEAVELLECHGAVVSTDEDFDEAAEEAIDRLLFEGDQLRKTLEAHTEGEDGPLPPEERPRLRAECDPDGAREELYDLMALCYQYDWALYGGGGE